MTTCQPPRMRPASFTAPFIAAFNTGARGLHCCAARVALSFAGLFAARAADDAPRASAPAPSIAPAFNSSLENGLRFTIQPHGLGLGRVSVRLIVHAGSLDERNDELGFAHFVEHMAFNGTRHYPPGKLIEFFQRLGLVFGPDLCATTALDHTLYRIDLPAGRAGELAEAMQVMRDFADGLEFPDAEVSREKGVILSELAARDNSDVHLTRRRLEALYDGTLLPRRFPIGTRASIEGATADGLRAYYQRCYRPDRMSLVITGDVAPATARSLVQKSFSTLAAAGTRVAPAGLATPAGGLRAHLITTKPESAGTVQVVALARRAPNNPASRQETLARELVMNLLDHRLAARRAGETNRFGDADATVDDGPSRHFRHYVVSASALARDWPAALQLVETELRRAREQGFTAAEVRERVNAFLAQRRSDRDAFAGQTPDLVADRISAGMIVGELWRHPAQAVAEAERHLANFTPELAQSTLQALFREEQMQLLLYSPSAPEGGRHAVIAAYRESASRPIAAKTAAGADLAFRYTDFGPPGGIADRRTESDLALTLVRYANDVKLNLRTSATEPGRFRLAARFGRGIADLPPDRPGLPHLASHLIGASDTGRHPREEISRLLALRAVEFHAGYADHFVASLEGPVAELPFALQLLTALIADLKLDPTRLEGARSDYAVCRSNKLSDCPSHARHATVVHMAGGDPRLSEPPVQSLRAYTFEEIAGWARTHCLENSLEVGVIGDFDPAAVIATAGASLGTLPPRRVPPGNLPPGAVLRTGAEHAILREPLPDKVAAVQVSWPAAGLGERRGELALILAASVLEDRLHKVLRQELGATYSPQGALLRQDDLNPDSGFVTVALTFDPDRAADLARRTIDLAGILAREGATEEEFARLHAPLAAKATEALHANEWWLGNVLILAQTVPKVVADARTFSRDIGRLTRADVNRAARDHFRVPAANSIIVYPAGPEGPAIADGSAAAFNASGERKLAAQDLAGALADFQRSLELDPQLAMSYVNRGAVRLMQGEWNEVIADCTRAIELDPGIATAHSNRGAARISLGDFTGAMADFTTALRLDPNNSHAYNNRGVARLRQGDIDGASADWSRAIELNPGNAKAFSNRGASKLRRGDVDGAIADGLTALQLDASDPDTHFNIGSARHQKGQTDLALADYSKALALNPNTPNVHLSRGKLRHARGDLNGALADYTDAIRLDPRSHEAFANRGIIRHGKGDIDGALADFSTVVELIPDHAPSRANRAGIRHLKKDFAGALLDAEKAVELDPRFADGYNVRGWVKQSNGDLDGAIADYTQAIELNPNHPLYYSNRGNARKAKGDRLGAIDDLDRALKLTPPAAAPTFVTSTQPAPAPTTPPPSKARPSTPSTSKARKAAPPSEAQALVRSGDARRLQRDFAGAIAEYDKAIALDPKLVSAYYHRGLAHQGTPDHAAAIADFDRAIALDARQALVYHSKGYSQQALGRFQQAVATLTQAIDRSPNHAPAWFYRGYSHRARGDLDKALADFNRVFELAPTYSNLHANRAVVHHARGDFDAALADYDQAIRSASDGARYAWLHRAVLKRQLQQGDPMGELTAAWPSWPAGWTREMARFVSGAISETEFLAQLAREERVVQSRTCEAHYFIGVMRLIAGDTAGARTHFEQSLATRQPRLFSTTLARAELRRLPAPARP